MQNSVCRQEVRVDLEDGLHLRPFSMIAEVARRHSCDLRIVREELSVDARNILELMTLNATRGTILTLEANGPGAAEAVAELAGLFTSNFDPGHSPRE